MHQKAPVRTALATERAQWQQWADKQRDALLDIGVDLIDAQRRVDWVLEHLPNGGDPSVWIPTGSDLDTPIDKEATSDANVVYMASDATPRRLTLLLSAALEDDTMAASRKFAERGLPLPSYTYSERAGRFRDSSNGQFVSRDRITALMEAHVADAESRLGKLDSAFAEKKIDASVWAASMRDEIKRLTILNESLGANGVNNLTPQQTGRAGGELRDRYARISSNAQQFANGQISQAQLMARTNAMVGECRAHYWLAEREGARVQDPNNDFIERRVISGGETCADCVNYYSQGWQQAGVLPVPGQSGSSVCRGNCKCNLLRREVPRGEIDSWIGTKR